jgi:hypothetical protein
MAEGLNPLPRLKSWDSNRAQPVTVASLLPLIAALGKPSAQRRAANVYQEIPQHDMRAPILFLRSFKEEKRLLEPPARSLLAKVRWLRHLKRTLDEIVLDAASPVGPVVALGTPLRMSHHWVRHASMRTMLNGKTWFVVSFNGAKRSLFASTKVTALCGS